MWNEKISPTPTEYYRIWSEEWGFSDEMISYAAELSSGRPRCFRINKTLSDFKSKGIDTVVRLRPKPTIKKIIKVIEKEIHQRPVKRVI